MRTCDFCHLQQRDSEYDDANTICRQCVALEALGLSPGQRYVKSVKEQEQSRLALLEYDRAERARRQRAEPQETPEIEFAVHMTIAQLASRCMFGRQPRVFAAAWRCE